MKLHKSRDQDWRGHTGSCKRRPASSRGSSIRRWARKVVRPTPRTSLMGGTLFKAEGRPGALSRCASDPFDICTLRCMKMVDTPLRPKQLVAKDECVFPWN